MRKHDTIGPPALRLQGGGLFVCRGCYISPHKNLVIVRNGVDYGILHCQ
jgi:hypothetical protein